MSQTEPRIHVFASDLHLCEDPASNPTSDEQLTAFAEELARLAGRRKPVRLVLVGDIVDLIRSKEWGLPTTEGSVSFPWSGATQGFSSFANSHAEQKAVEIVRRIRDRYKQFEKRLRKLVTGGELDVVYLYGNHDYMAQLSRRVRSELQDFLSVGQGTTGGFDETYCDRDPAVSVYAVHGHSYDPVNWHDAPGGRWAFGDAVVLRVVNRFADRARREMGVSAATSLAGHFEDLDNVEPHSEVPIFVHWISQQLTVSTQRKRLQSIWHETVSEFLADPAFHPVKWYQWRKKHLYHENAFHLVRRALKLSQNRNVARIGSFILRHLPVDDYRRHALTLAEQQQSLRFIVMGHTHIPVLTPLDHVVGEDRSYYVNTGCWKKVVSRPHHDRYGPYASHRIACWFIIDPTDAVGRYRFVQQRYAT